MTLPLVKDNQLRQKTPRSFGRLKSLIPQIIIRIIKDPSLRINLFVAPVF